MTQTIETHYDNLKVTRTAPVEVIKASYRVLSQKYHPDRNPDPAALSIMKVINQAWDVLSDPERRATHDRWIANQEQQQAARRPVPAAYRQKNGDADAGSASTLPAYALRLSVLVGAALAVLLGAAFFMKAFDRVDLAPGVSAQDMPASGASAPAPIERPAHGYLTNAVMDFSSGPASFEIDNTDGDKDAEVRLYRAGSAVHSVFAHKGERLVIENMVLGTYVVKYKLVVDGKARAFQANKEFPLIQTAEEANDGRYNKYNKIRDTVFNLAGGNVTSNEIPLDQF